MRAGCLALLSVLLLAILAPPEPADAQTVIEVENSANVQYENSAYVDLEGGGTMDFRGPGTFSRLDERDAARVTNGQLTATRDVGAPSDTDVAGLGAVLTASKDLGDVTVTRGHTNQNAGGGSMDRYYDVSATQNNSGLDATLTLRYEDAELAGLAEGDLLFLTSTDGGSSFTARGIDGQDTGADTATLNGVSSFSRWTLGTALVDLQLSAVASEPERGAGEQTAATVTLTHADGTIDASGVEVGVSVESGILLQGGTASTGSYSGGTWDVGTLSSGSSATLDLTVEQDNAQPGAVDAQVTALNQNDDTPAQAAASVVPPPYGSGSALTLDGSGDYVATGAGGGDLGLAGESFTVDVWFKPASLPSSGDHALVGMDGGSDNRTLHLGLEPGGGVVMGFFGNDLRTGTAPVSTGTWQHLTFVYDATKADGQTDRYIYYNGTQIASNEASADLQGTREVLVGRWGGGNYFDGQIDQVRIWPDALTGAQIRTRMRRTTDPTTADPLAAYRFDAGSGTTAYDVVSADAKSQNGSLQGDASFQAVSGAGLGQTAAAVESGSQTLGPGGGSVAVANVSTSGSDALQVYQYGTTGGPQFSASQDGEDFSQISDDVTKRLHVVWGLEAIGSATADVTIDYSQMQGLSDPQNVRLLKRSRPGAPWQDVSDQWTWDAQAQTFQKTAVSSFSQYAVGEASTALPVEMAGFEGRRTGEGVRLIWTTASERNNAGFAVQRTRGEAGNDWQTIGRVDGAGTTDAPQTYRFTDDDVPFAADSLAYRLRQVDTDGTAALTEPITVEMGVPDRLRLHAPFPNPASDRATLRLEVPSEQAVSVRLYDVLGRRVRTVRRGPMEAGRTQTEVDLSGLAAGTYFVRLTGETGSQTRRLTVVP